MENEKTLIKDLSEELNIPYINTNIGYEITSNDSDDFQKAVKFANKFVGKSLEDCIVSPFLKANGDLDYMEVVFPFTESNNSLRLKSFMDTNKVIIQVSK